MRDENHTVVQGYPPHLTVVVAKTGRDDFQQYFACIGSKRNPSSVLAIRAIFLSVKDLDDHIFPLLGDFSCYPYIDKDAVKALDEFGVIEFQ